jgi:hypothetical protein
MLPMNVSSPARAFVWRVLVQATILLCLVNLAYGWLPRPTLSVYGNAVFPARPRLPYSSNPSLDYAISLSDLPALFATHTLTHTPKAANEYRVLLLGDSATWGFLLPNAATLASQLNQLAQPLPNGKTPAFYNIGYPTLSVSKDLLLLAQARQYQPDLIVWLLTLESLPNAKQLESPVVQSNRAALQTVFGDSNTSPDWQDARWQPAPSGWQRTLFGQRKAAADWLRMQVYAIPWAATGIDQAIPTTIPSAQQDLNADDTFHGMAAGTLTRNQLAWSVLQTGIEQVAPTPVWLVNEPMLRSTGKNSAIRYNFFYPRAAYDWYRQEFAALATQQAWQWYDWWDVLPNTVFTDSAIHYNQAGSALLAQRLWQQLQTSSK